MAVTEKAKMQKERRSSCSTGKMPFIFEGKRQLISTAMDIAPMNRRGNLERLGVG